MNIVHGTGTLPLELSLSAGPPPPPGTPEVMINGHEAYKYTFTDFFAPQGSTGLTDSDISLISAATGISGGQSSFGGAASFDTTGLSAAQTRAFTEFGNAIYNLRKSPPASQDITTSMLANLGAQGCPETWIANAIGYLNGIKLHS